MSYAPLTTTVYCTDAKVFCSAECWVDHKCYVINDYVIILFVTCSYTVIVKGYKGYCTQLALEISRTFLTSTIKVCIVGDFYSQSLY